MLSTLYLLKWLKAERRKTEPIPDRPGYFETTLWHEPIEWPASFKLNPKIVPNHTVLIDECPDADHNKCPITNSKPTGKISEVCMCRCHPHAKPAPKEPEPIIGLAALKDRAS
jgi:hypothetical protein